MTDCPPTRNTLTVVSSSETMKLKRPATMMLGRMMGKVTFQKVSQPVAPSIFATSYMLSETVCKAAIKIRIWMPDFHMS